MAAGTLTSLTPNLALSVCGSRILAVSTWCCTDDRHNTWVSRRARSPDMLLSRGAGGCGCGAPHRSDELPELLHHALAPQLQQDSSTGPPYIKGWIMVLYRRESKASEHGAVCACCSSSGVDRWWVVAVCTTRLSLCIPAARWWARQRSARSSPGSAGRCPEDDTTSTHTSPQCIGRYRRPPHSMHMTLWQQTRQEGLDLCVSTGAPRRLLRALHMAALGPSSMR